MEYELISTIQKKNEPNEVLELFLGFDNDVMFGYFVQAIPKKITEKKGVEIIRFNGENVREKKIMGGKHFSKKRFQLIKDMIYFDVRDFVLSSFPMDEKIKSFFEE